MTEAHRLLASFLHAAALVQEQLEAALAPSGLSLAKIGALRHLADSGEPLALGQLAERIACVKSNVTQLVDRLEGDGLVRRVPDPEDRRCVRAAITDEGRVRYQAGIELLLQAEHALVSELPPADRQVLGNLLERLTLVPSS